MTTESILRIPADLEDLAHVRAFVREQARRAGADETVVADLVQAVDESVCNSITHGYKGKPGAVEIAVDKADEALVVTLRDHAPAFDPTTVPARDVDAPLSKQKLGGLGVHLTRELTDSISYRHTDEGNELTLTKRLSRRGDDDAADRDRA